MVRFPHLSGLCLERHLSDHRLIITFESSFDYGPTPFRMFHSWFLMEGFDKFVETSWHSMNITDSNGLIRMKKKLQILKNAIKTWGKENKTNINGFKSSIQNKLSEVEKSIDQGGGTEKVLNKRSSLIKELNDINSIDALDLSQKAKIHPPKVKAEFLNHFLNQFSNPSSPRIKIDSEFPTRLNSNQVEDLERPISQEEIKKAVWDCGTSKSPGPDGFTFEFFHKYRDILNHDIIVAIHDFSSSVMSDLISDVQTTFVSSRQILDGPFILNEFLSWCKHKKINAMIFKVDFEKAFDSIRWDYLYDVLKSFSFGIKWRSWISGCLDSSMGSVLVNSSPTLEFHFYKGLKQGDPLSPFLFILVMESLHISFSRVIAFGLFKGVNINNSLTLLHVVYTDDAIFVGKWDINNIKTIVNVLNCFFLASGLKINLHKSKLTRIGVNKDDVDSTTTLVGCSTFYPPFHYLGVKVGASMSRLNSWKEVTAKISYRLSKWKLKTLSIGGRLTLLKSVLTAIPIYHMSLYKVPVGILNDMESIRRNFFNGIESPREKRFIQAIHGVRGAIDNKNSSIKGSIWLDIVRDISSLNHKGIDLLATAKKEVGNGENTLFWEDKWIGEVTLKTKYPRLFALEQHKSITVAAKMGQPSLDHSFRRLPRGGIEDEQYRDLRTTTSNVLLPNMHDRWFWSLNYTGEFSGIVRGRPADANTKRVPHLSLSILALAYTKFALWSSSADSGIVLTRINHQTFVARTPEQNGVVERRNRTLVEAARTMLSATKVPLFFWAEAIVTTCFTQNRSFVIPRHEKTPYHIINDRKPSVKFFYIFGSLCYIVKDGENLDKMKEKDHVSSDPVPQCQTTALEHDSLSPDPQCQENVPHVAGTVTTSNELDFLFSRMFDELLNGSTQVVLKSSAVTPADAHNQCQQQHITPLNTHTTPEPTCYVPTQAPTVSSTENINQAKIVEENAQVENDKFIHIFCTPVQDRGETLSHHRLEQVIGNPSQSVRTRRQLESDGEMCMFALTVSRTELKNIKEAMVDSAWIESMQEELHQFD
uniref:Putative RNA-directed DNA polymerase, eukaryota, reverse transcriptase zinc-binding domain protein n=1 Tax=Tanacetum cinerariifolium TaxID=118510 RepID=A0A699HA67_TANCI|nr:putative RNA-directed DNA polymerase, eukaryota, reverse transcriptase zinc-binding domain protein [Tanacetum cinerariifolium]